MSVRPPHGVARNARLVAAAAVLLLCVAIGVAAIVVLRSVVQNVRDTLTREARAIVGADLVVQSTRPWTAENVETLAS